MADVITLRGITWDHSRGFTPMAATGQRFSELNAGVEVVWDKRSLQAFADQSIDALAKTYDLLVLDHPWAGFAARTRVIVALDELLATDFLEDQQANSVGASYASYSQDGRQLALAIDAATPVACCRPDLLERHGLETPTTWDELLGLARDGWVTVPGAAIDTLMSFYMVCSTLGEDIAQSADRLVSPDIGRRALTMLRELAALLAPESFSRNPIQVYEAMTTSDDYAYCPFAYGYSNYSRDGYARRKLIFQDMPALEGRPLRSTLGGAGLAISAHCRNREAAASYARFVASPSIQRTLYAEAGGQPGHRAAWQDDELNRRTSNYFRNTLPALDRAFLRPRYNGYMRFQDHAGAPLREFLMHGGDERLLLRELDRLYRESLPGSKQ